MSIHGLFKLLLKTDNNSISRTSGAEIAFNSWKKDKDMEKENYTYLTDLYIKTHETPRSERNVAYEIYNTEKQETIDEFYKKQQSTNINRLISANMSEVLFKPDSRIFTKYNLPSLLEVSLPYESDERFIIVNKE